MNRKMLFGGIRVAPRRGAWIEITKHKFTHLSLFVAPRRGAWIEITIAGYVDDIEASRSPQGSVD